MQINKDDLSAKVRYWADEIGLDPAWQIDVSLEMPEEMLSSEATCQTDEYWRVLITFNLPIIAEEDLDLVIVHELLHVLLDDLKRYREALCTTEALRNYGQALEERAIEKLSRAIIERGL